MAKCKKCGLPIAFKRVGEKFYPTNLDGTQHWDICKITMRAGKPFNKKVDMQSAGWFRGGEFVDSGCDCIPWVGCDVCCNVVSDGLQHLRDIMIE